MKGSKKRKCVSEPKESTAPKEGENPSATKSSERNTGKKRKRTTRLALERPATIETLDVFVRKGKGEVYKRWAEKMLRKSGRVVVHGAGAAILTAVEVAVWTEKQVPFPVEQKIETGTEIAMDQDKETLEVSERNVSTIRIELSKKTKD